MQRGRSSRDNGARNWSNDNDIISFHEPARRFSSLAEVA